MLKREIGATPLSALNAVTLRDFIDRRTKAGAGGVTIAADLSFFSAVLKWARYARHLDVPEQLGWRRGPVSSTAASARAARNVTANRSTPSSSCSTLTGAQNLASGST